jgi:hypothetical protein
LEDDHNYYKQLRVMAGQLREIGLVPKIIIEL